MSKTQHKMRTQMARQIWGHKPGKTLTPKATTFQARRLIVAISKNYFELDISHMGNITS